jgi:oxygen-independent coproporphyrinogen-3 oxidase
VHWPWCENKCPYCDFNSHVNKNYSEDEYIQTLLKHIDYYAEKLGNRQVISIFFGGGTPSLMQPSSINQIVEYINSRFSLDTSSAEISMEANPSSSNLNKLKDFKNAGINRLSIGVQSFHDDLLNFLGRRHNKDQALSTIENARTVFENVSTDLIYGLPNQKLDAWQKDLERILQFDLNHISCYQLTIEKQTAFYKQVISGEWEPILSDTQADFFDLTRETIVSQNMDKMVNYEISNFAKPNFECKHNVHVWQYQDYIGIGAGAHGRFTDHTGQYFLSQNIKMPNKYMYNINNLNNFSFILDHIAPEQSFGEMILMGLRLKNGIDMKNLHNNLFFKDNFNNDLNNWAEFKRMEQFGFVKKTDSHLQITTQGWPILDSITSNLLTSIQNT